MCVWVCVLVRLWVFVRHFSCATFIYEKYFMANINVLHALGGTITLPSCRWRWQMPEETSTWAPRGRDGCCLDWQKPPKCSNNTEKQKPKQGKLKRTAWKCFRVEKHRETTFFRKLFLWQLPERPVDDTQINGWMRPNSVCLFSCGRPNKKKKKKPFDTCNPLKVSLHSIPSTGRPSKSHSTSSSSSAERLPIFMRLAAFKHCFDYVKHSLERQDELFENTKPATCTKTCQHTGVCVCGVCGNGVNATLVCITNQT